MIADRFNDDENERQRSLGIALAFISFGSLVAPPFGGLLYEFCGKELPFILLSLVCLADGILLLFVMQPVKQKAKESGVVRPDGTPIHVLLKDPFIACCAGALIMANVSLAFLEPTISIWMQDHMQVEEWQIGMIWLPAFFPHVLGVWTTVRVAKRYPNFQWAIAGIGLGMEGLSCLLVPFSSSFWGLFLPISGICFGIALVDTAILPLLAHIVDTRHVSVYGSIYAIADISYSLAYAFGPVFAGGIVSAFGFTALNVIIAVTNLAYVPVLSMLKHCYEMRQYNQFAAETDEQRRAAAAAAGAAPAATLLPATGATSLQQQQPPQSLPMATFPTATDPWADDPAAKSTAHNPFTSPASRASHHGSNHYGFAS